MKNESKKMSKKRLPKVSKINTKYLIQISNNHRIEGTTETGADYAHIIEEVQSELFWRQTRQAERAHEEAQRALTLAEATNNGTARQCTKCLTRYPIEQVAQFFSKVAGKENHYRPACKACHANEAKARRALSKIEAPF
jgi:hypothetical protein